MSTEIESNKARIRTMLAEVWNDRRSERLGEFFGEELRAEGEALHRMLTTGFPDLEVDVDDVVAEGDRVVVRLRFRGTHRGTFQGIEPTGRRVEFGAIRIYRLVDVVFADVLILQTEDIVRMR